MSAHKNFKSESVSSHIGRFSFDLYHNEQKLVSAGEDCVFKEYTISKGGLNLERQLNCDEVSALCVCQGSNDIILGLNENQKILKVGDLENIDEITGEEIAGFQGSASSLRIGGQNEEFLAIAYDDNRPSIVKLTNITGGTSKLRTLSQEHNGSCIYASVDSKGRFGLSVGKEGNVNIYQGVESFDKKEPPFDASFYLNFAHELAETTRTVQAEFNDDSSQIAVGGGQHLSLIERDQNNKWNIKIIPMISHEKAIHICFWAHFSQILITAGLDRRIKIWRWADKKLLAMIECQEELTAVKYSKVNNALFASDCEGNILRWNGVDLTQMLKVVSSAMSSAQKQDVSDIFDDDNEGETAKSYEDKKTNKGKDSIKQNRDIEKEVKEQENEKKQAVVLDPKEERRLKLEALSNQITEQQEQQKQKLRTEYSDEGKDESQAGNINSEEKKITQQDILETQQIVYSSSTSKQSNRSCLLWNLVGRVILREEEENLFLDVDFSDKELHSKLTIKNQYNYTLAAMNDSALVLASKAISSSAEYENEEYFERFDFHPDAYENSYLSFRTLSKSPEQWTVSLAKEENAESVALGEGWCAVQTDSQQIRIYEFSGMEQNCFSIGKPVICMSGFKHLLAYVYLDGEPVCGCQSLRVRILDTKTGEILKETGLPVSPYSMLKWFGFSEEGMLLTQDSNWIIRALVANAAWTPLYQINAFWLKGMFECKAVGFQLAEGEKEPMISKILSEKCLEIDPPLPNGGLFDGMEEYRTLRKKQLIVKQLQYAYLHFGSSPKQMEVLQKAQREVDQKILVIFQKCITAGEHFKGMKMVRDNILNPMYIDSCILVAKKEHLRHVEQDLLDLQVELRTCTKVFRAQRTHTSKEIDDSLRANANLSKQSIGVKRKGEEKMSAEGKRLKL